jgi:DNA-binding FadR family transcriptional regulator
VYDLDLDEELHRRFRSSDDQERGLAHHRDITGCVRSTVPKHAQPVMSQILKLFTKSQALPAFTQSSKQYRITVKVRTGLKFHQIWHV